MGSRDERPIFVHLVRERRPTRRQSRRGLRFALAGAAAGFVALSFVVLIRGITVLI